MLKHVRLVVVLGATLLLSGLVMRPALAQEPYLGEIRCFAFNFTPIGWAPLNGQLLPINQNQALFALLGTTYGGDGQSTFALPNMQGRIMLNTNNGTHPVGDQGGNETTTLGVANLPPHAHAFAPLGSTNDASSVSPAGQVQASKARTTLYTSPANIVPMAAGVTSATGSGVPVSTMPPYLTFNCNIAMAGIFPSRN